MSPGAEYEAAARALCDAGRGLAAHGLTPGTSGNISVRVRGGYVMSPTNAALGELTTGDVALLDERGEHLCGGQPTKERELHLALYNRRPEARDRARSLDARRRAVVPAARRSR